MKKKIFLSITLCIPFIVLELLFRLMPVSYPPHLLNVNEKSPIPRFQANKKYLWSKGWDFKIVTRKQTNNLGFVSDFEYIRSDLDPLMVVIGDSYVEAHQVANSESLSGILAKKTRKYGRVYSIGLSGAALSQYLVFAEYANNNLSPNSLVFIIVGNDFNENFLKPKSSPRFHYFEKKDSTFVLTRIDYKFGGIKKVLRKSAFIRYLMLNLEIRHLLEKTLFYKNNSTMYVGNVPKDVGTQRLKEYEIGVDEFFKQLPGKSGLDKKNILFVVDGIRPNLYTEQGLLDAKDSGNSHMRTYFILTAERLGYEVKDMQPIFIKKNRSDGSIFEFPTDGHWNQLGHKLVGTEIESSNLYKKTFLNP